MDIPRKSISPRGLDLIKAFEGIADGDPSTVNLDPYLDPVGIWSIGYGHAITRYGRKLRGAADRSQARSLYPGGLTREQCEMLLRSDLAPVELYLAAAVPTATQRQFDALASFAFNAGIGNLDESTLLRKFKAGDVAGAADQFLAWTKSHLPDGSVVEPAGLVRRRRAERALFLEGEFHE